MGNSFHLQKRGGVWYIWYLDDDGKRQRKSTGCSKKVDAQEYMTRFIRGDVEQRARLTNISLAKFQLEFIDYRKTRQTQKTVASDRSALRELEKHLGDKQLRSITLRELETFIGRKQQRSAATAKRLHLTLAAAFQTATRWGYLDENLWRKIQKPKPPEKTKPHLNLVEIQTLIGHITDNELLLHMVLVAFNTGFRLGELRNLHFSDIDFNGKMLYARNTAQFTTKSKKERAVPLNDTALEILTQRNAQAEPTDLVFGLNGKVISESYVSRAFKTYIVKAGLNPELNFHSLRHSFASNLVESGAPLPQVQKLMGHASYNTTLQYSHLIPENLRPLVDVLNIRRNDRFDIKVLPNGWYELTPNPNGRTLANFKDKEKYYVTTQRDGKLLLYPRYFLDAENVE